MNLKKLHKFCVENTESEDETSALFTILANATAAAEQNYVPNQKNMGTKYNILILKNDGTEVAKLEFDAESTRDYVLANNLTIKTSLGYVMKKGEQNV
jgi:hypothetical protein